MAELVSVQIHTPFIGNASVTNKTGNNTTTEFQDAENSKPSDPKIEFEPNPEKSENGAAFLHKCGKGKKNLEFRNIKYHVVLGRGKEDKPILKDISGVFKSGDLTAIMGPSGAGKSSLMNILAGYSTKNLSGDIMVNGRLRSLRKFRKMSCYIMQDDHLLPTITVEETMMCSANLKLEASMCSSKKKELVSDILDCLGLQEARHTRCMFLSGGQRKRLSIAQELINNPPIMFFDEPTSGLDSASCYQCISLLSSLAKGGRTIICTIHQPSAKLFEMFNNLYFLADGHCIYRGPVIYLVEYLKTQSLICPSYHNPADYFMEVACNEFGNQTPRLSEAVKSGTMDTILKSLMASDDRSAPASPYITRGRLSISLNEESSAQQSLQVNGELTVNEVNGSQESFNNESIEVSRLDDDSSDDEPSNQPRDKEEHTFATSTFVQFKVLFVRTFMSIMRDTTLTRLRLLSNVAVGLMIGLLYFRVGNNGNKFINNAAFIFFCLLFIMFTALMPTVLTFPLEMGVFKREHLNYWYSLKAYYLAKTIADMPFQIIFPVLYGAIVYWMTEQPAEFDRFLMFLIICILTALVGQSIGLVIGAATSLQVAVFLGPVTAIPILLFSGFFINFDTIPKYLQWFSYLAYIRYAFEGALQAIYGNDRIKLDCPDQEISSKSLPCMEDPKLILEFLAVDKAKFYIDFIILLVIFALLRLLCYFILRWRIKGQR